MRIIGFGCDGDLNLTSVTVEEDGREYRFENSHWISVEERLPEDDVNVLVHAVSNGDDVDSCIAMTSYTHHMHGFNIEGWRSPWQYFFFDYMITHWMPLPEPPKESAK